MQSSYAELVEHLEGGNWELTVATANSLLQDTPDDPVAVDVGLFAGMFVHHPDGHVMERIVKHKFSPQTERWARSAAEQRGNPLCLRLLIAWLLSMEDAKVSESIWMLKETAKAYPSSFEAQLCLGLSYYGTNGAVNYLKRSIQLERDHPLSYWFLASTYSSMKQMQSAITTVNQGLAACSDLPMLLLGKAKILKEMSKTEEAKVIWRKIVDDHPDTLEAAKAKKSLDQSCFVATAACGFGGQAELCALRAFRDEILQKTTWGQQFIDWYTRFGPYLARQIERNRCLRRCVFWIVVKPAAALAHWALKSRVESSP